MNATSDARDLAERCQAQHSDGTPCTASAGRSGYCIGHHPSANRSRTKGGAATSTANRAAKLLPSRLRPIVETLEQAFYQVHHGDLEPKQAVAMATVANAIGKLITLAEYEERLRVLEENAQRIESERQHW